VTNQGPNRGPARPDPIVKVTAKGSGRISLAGLTCYRPGQRSRLVYRAMVHKGRKGEKKGFRPVEKVWSHLKRSLANLAAGNATNLSRLAKTKLRKMQYVDGLIDGFFRATGLSSP
jgi:hypothetical protein